MAVNLPDCPPSLKSIQHYLKTASEHDGRDFVVAYWCRLHALQMGMKLNTKKTMEEAKLLMGVMDWLEEQKKTHKDNEAITNDVAAQAHLENYALKLFLYADKQDREQSYGKNVVKAFYTAGMIYDVLTEFGELTDEAAQNRKYAKWKAAYIHNCLKNGETPVPGPMPTEEDAGDLEPGPSNIQTTDIVQPPAPNPSNTPDVSPSNTSVLPDPSAVNQLPNVPVTPELNPGGFVPYMPTATSVPPQPAVRASPSFGDGNQVTLSADQVSKAQKYCKWASSALNYDDVKTAITNLSNALELLQTGRDPA